MKFFCLLFLGFFIALQTVFVIGCIPTTKQPIILNVTVIPNGYEAVSDGETGVVQINNKNNSQADSNSHAKKTENLEIDPAQIIEDVK